MINLPVSIRRALVPAGFAALTFSISLAADARASHAAQHLLSRDDLKTVSEATRLANAGKLDAATTARDHIRDPVGRKLAEWVILRGDGGTEFARYANFIHANPAWPGMPLLQRRAEARLWIERADAATVRAFFSGREPRTALGQLAMARALASLGDARAVRYASSAWRSEGFSASTEAEVLKLFGPRLTQADHAARMHSRLYANDFDTAMRAAKHLGPGAVAIAAARAAVIRKKPNAAALLAKVPSNVRSDAAYQFTRIQWLRRSGRDSEAAQLMLSAPRDQSVINSPDLWWVERRALVRSLLDDGKAKLAYRLAHDAAPEKETYRVDRAFMAGWIALRFLRDPQTASRHFNEIPGLTRGPTALARAQYWLGRAAEAGRNRASAQQHYALASQHGTTYYGQLACARMSGCRQTKLRTLPALNQTQRATLTNRELVRAVEILYASGNRRLVVPFVGDLGRTNDTTLLAMVAESARQHRDPGAMLAVGRAALNRGLAFDSYAFPAAGLPDFAPIGAKTDKSLVYAITRTESAFNPRITSGALATGYMQVTPAAGQTLARRMGFTFSTDRLHNDPAYNLQLGSAEIANLLSDYDGNHVLAFVGYNAGRGRVRQWIERYGDPRQTNVDVVDWVERIPYAETRNYVQRVLENLQVYRSRFGSPTLAIEADMRGRQS